MYFMRHNKFEKLRRHKNLTAAPADCSIRPVLNLEEPRRGDDDDDLEEDEDEVEAE